MEDLRKVIDINISSEKFYKNNSYTNKWRLNYHLEPPLAY